MSAFDGAIFVVSVMGWILLFLVGVVLAVFIVALVIEAIILVWDYFKARRIARAEIKRREKIYGN